MSKVPVVELPRNVFAIRKRLADGTAALYYYYQAHRKRPKGERGPLIRLPEPNAPGWHAKLAEIEGRATATPQGSFDAVWIGYQKSHYWPTKEASRKAYNAAFKHVSAAWGNLPVSGVTGPDIAAMRDALADKPGMAKLVHAVIVNLLAYAVEKGLRPDNPAKAVKRMRSLQDGAKPVTSEAWAALISAAAPECVRRYAWLARATGQRISDVVKFRPQDRVTIDDIPGIRHVIKKTTRAAHFSPIPDEYLTAIDAMQGFPARPYVSHGPQVVSESYVRRAWHDFARTEAGAALSGFTPHDLRATKMCDELLKGKTELEIANMIGVVPQMVQRYTRHISQELVAVSSAKKSQNSA